MYNSNDYIKNIKEYGMAILATNIRTSPIRKQLLEKIPIIVAQNFDLYEGNILGIDVVLACQTGEDVFTPAQVKKMMTVLEQKTGHIAIYVANHIASYHVTGTQMKPDLPPCLHRRTGLSCPIP